MLEATTTHTRQLGPIKLLQKNERGKCIDQSLKKAMKAMERGTTPSRKNIWVMEHTIIFPYHLNDQMMNMRIESRGEC